MLQVHGDARVTLSVTADYFNMLAAVETSNPGAFIGTEAANGRLRKYTIAQAQAALGVGGVSGSITSGPEYRLAYYSTNPSGTTLAPGNAIAAGKVLMSDSNGVPIAIPDGTPGQVLTYTPEPTWNNPVTNTAEKVELATNQTLTAGNSARKSV